MNKRKENRAYGLKAVQLHREFRGVSLWRGRRWFQSQDWNETGLGEAGSQWR
jgi:hypothetical protein